MRKIIIPWKNQKAKYALFLYIDFQFPNIPMWSRYLYWLPKIPSQFFLCVRKNINAVHKYSTQKLKIFILTFVSFSDVKKVLKNKSIYGKMIKTQKFYFLLPLFTEKGIMKHAQIRRIHVSPFLIIAAVIHTYAPISVCVILFFSKLMGMHMIRCSKRYISFITPYGLKYILVRNIINARLCCSLQKASK